jgi:hypothetical protein
MKITDKRRQALLRIEAEPERQCEPDEASEVVYLFSHGLIRDVANQPRFFDRRHVVTPKGDEVLRSDQ